MFNYKRLLVSLDLQEVCSIKKAVLIVSFLFVSTAHTAWAESISDAKTVDPANQAQILPFSGLKTDIPIGEVDGVMLRINIARPEGKSDTARPAIVLIHGGGLIKGNKNLLNKRIKMMAKRGYVAASAMYRLASERPFPAAVEDVKTAVRFLKANAKSLNIDPDRIIASGSSAGGYLAVMLGVTGNAQGFADHGLYSGFDSTVQAVVTHAAPIGDYRLAKYKKYAVVKRFINRDNPDENAALAAISPITYLDSKDPPFFLDHGSADERVPVSMSREFVSALKAIAHTYEYIEVEGGKHSLNASRPEKASEVFRASMAFIDKYAYQESD